jgi:hypothetical protein
METGLGQTPRLTCTVALTTRCASAWKWYNPPLEAADGRGRRFHRGQGKEAIWYTGELVGCSACGPS